MTEPQPFGITVTHSKNYDDWDDEADDYRPDPSRWHVRLPHQCSDWDIAGERTDGVTHAEAVAELERFILEAAAALDALRQGETYPREGASS